MGLDSVELTAQGIRFVAMSQSRLNAKSIYDGNPGTPA